MMEEIPLETASITELLYNIISYVDARFENRKIIALEININSDLTYCFFNYHDLTWNDDPSVSTAKPFKYITERLFCKKCGKWFQVLKVTEWIG